MLTKLKGGDTMNLNERKIKILRAIISNYLETGEPVGSRTISKYYDLGISPATIRNEMSDLEDLGFILQPHTSAGRIPSDKGYRLYVDKMMDAIPCDITKYIAYMEHLIERVDRIELILKDIAKMLADNTNYASIVSSPQFQRTKLKNIQLISIDAYKLLAVIVTDGNIIKNYIIDINDPIDQSVLNNYSFILNNQLYGLTIEEINLPLIQQLKAYAGSNADIINKILDAVFDTIRSVNNTDVFTSGTTNILKFPEFNDVSKASNLIHTLEHKEIIKGVIDELITTDNQGVRIMIGDENIIKDLKDCSLITANYKIDGENIGIIGVIGPKRMDYAKAVSSLKYIIDHMDKIINKPNG